MGTHTHTQTCTHARTQTQTLHWKRTLKSNTTTHGYCVRVCCHVALAYGCTPGYAYTQKQTNAHEHIKTHIAVLWKGHVFCRAAKALRWLRQLSLRAQQGPSTLIQQACTEKLIKRHAYVADSSTHPHTTSAVRRPPPPPRRPDAEYLKGIYMAQVNLFAQRMRILISQGVRTTYLRRGVRGEP